MEIGAALWAGLVGAAVMTIFYSLICPLGLPRIDMAGILGTLISAPGSRAARLGIVLHFLAGAVAAFIYVLLWENVFGSVDYIWGAIFGAIHGFISVLLIPFLLLRHPHADALDISPTPKTTLAVVLGHTAFGVAVALQYGAMA
jgi:uncharacterized membrane protein YagU involved in acid resistance